MSDTITLRYKNHTITLRAWLTNRQREQIRQLDALAQRAGLPYSTETVSEFLLALAYTIEGDEDIWARPGAMPATGEALREAIEAWLDAPAAYTRALMDAILRDDPLAEDGPTPLPEGADPN